MIKFSFKKQVSILSVIVLIFILNSQVKVRLVPERKVKQKFLKSYKINKNWRELTLLKVIPGVNENKFFFRNPSDMCFSDDGRLFVVDNFLSQITVLTNEGDFIRTFGKFGQGPGEFNYPLRIEIDEKDTLYVYQGGRMTMLNTHGKFLDLYHILFTVDDFVIARGRVYANKNYRPKENIEGIIQVLDKTGKTIFSFGEPYWISDLKINDEAVLLATDQQRLFVCFRHHPVLRIYNLDGQLIKEIRVNLDILNRLEKLVSDPKYTGIKYNPRAIPRLPRLMAGLAVYDNRIYILLHLPRIEILSLDMDGKILNHYYYNNINDIINYGYGFLVRKEYGALRFYVSNSPEGKIYIFEYNNKNYGGILK